MNVAIDLQIATQVSELPSAKQIGDWACLALFGHGSQAETSAVEDYLMTVRLVDDQESLELNLGFRGKDKPTNVLSFANVVDDLSDLDVGDEIAAALAEEQGAENYLGDLVINAPLVQREAEQQGKAYDHHLAHLVIHGCLHLQGYDHIEPEDAQIMEGLEVTLLAQLGIANPYA